MVSLRLFGGVYSRAVTPRTAFVCAGVVAGVATVWAAGAGEAFGVGVLRRAGVVIPFATFDGRQWRSSWPAPQPGLEVPINMSSVPSRWWGATGPLDTWQALVDGAERPIRVTQPDWVGVHCARHI